MEKAISRTTGNLLCRCPQDGQWQSVRVCTTCPHFKGYVDGIPVCFLEKVKKIRRRVEDRLRKSDPETILRVARELGVKIDL